MNTYAKDWDHKRGSALFSVLAVIVAASALLGIILTSNLQRIYTAKRLADRIRAISIAEAGAHKAYSILATNFAARASDSEFPFTSYADGSFDVTVSPITNNMAVITSVGHYGGATETVVLDIKKYGGSDATFFDWDLDEYAILCGGNFDFMGCGDITGTNGSPRLHSNGVLTVTGNAQTGIDITSSIRIIIGNNKVIDGSVMAPILSYDPSKVTITEGATTAAVPPVEIPDVDLTPYYVWANAHGEVYNGLNVSSGTLNPNGGVIWVNGDVQLSSHVVVNGSIIATGDVKVSGDVDINAPGTFAIASRDGNIDYTSSGATYGVIYAKMGNYSQTANGQIEGQIVIKGNIKKGGNSDVVVYQDTNLTPPGGDPSQDGIIGLSAWQK